MHAPRPTLMHACGRTRKHARRQIRARARYACARMHAQARHVHTRSNKSDDSQLRVCAHVVRAHVCVCLLRRAPGRLQRQPAVRRPPRRRTRCVSRRSARPSAPPVRRTPEQAPPRRQDVGCYYTLPLLGIRTIIPTLRQSPQLFSLAFSPSPAIRPTPRDAPRCCARAAQAARTCTTAPYCTAPDSATPYRSAPHRTAQQWKTRRDLARRQLLEWGGGELWRGSRV
jgi:hypothetical protein